MSTAQEIYIHTVRVLPVQERLPLAAPILNGIVHGEEFTESRLSRSEEQRQTALANLLQHAGTISSGHTRAAENEQIDADLAREYGKDL